MGGGGDLFLNYTVEDGHQSVQLKLFWSQYLTACLQMHKAQYLRKTRFYDSKSYKKRILIDKSFKSNILVKLSFIHRQSDSIKTCVTYYIR